MERRLAAILSADIAGYSRMIGEDEAGTLAALRRLRAEVLGPSVSGHRGQVVKSMGDGWLIEFASAADAVRCALQVQDRLAGHPTMRLRIGLHIGDVVHDEEDIFGDGVNIATRLQEVADPGGIAVSGTALASVDGSLSRSFTDSGEQSLKNIAQPVRVWRRAAGPGAPEPAAARVERPSIAVLAFANLSGDPAQEYFSDGVSEEILTSLARCRWLSVVARNSSFSYKGSTVDVRRVARELGVGYVLEGSVRRAGDRIRITAELADGRSGARLWSERYDRDLGDIFALQDEIAATIAGTVGPELSAVAGAALRDRPTGNLTAWDCYHRGLWHLYRFTVDDLGTARELFERAIRLDPSMATAHARLAYVHIQLGWYAPRAERRQRIEDAIALSRTAIRLDERDPAAYVSLGRALALAGAAERGVDELRTAIGLDPSFAQAHFALAQVLTFLLRADEALVAVEEALRLSPRDPHLWTFLQTRAAARYIAGDLDRAASDARAAMRQPNASFWPALNLTAVLGGAGRRDEAGEAIRELHRLRPDMTCADARREFAFGDRVFMPESFIERFVGDLRAAGLPE